MKTKKIAAITGAVALGLAAAGPYMAQPLINEYAVPVLQQQLHNAVNGQVSYSSLGMTWNGNVAMDDVTVKDSSDTVVAHIDRVTVDLSYGKILGLLAGMVEPENIVSGIIIDHPELYLIEKSDGWNVSHLLKEREKKEKKDLSYNGYIVLEKGAVHLAPKDGEALDLTAIQAKVDFANTPSADLVASFHRNDEVVRIIGSVDTKAKEGTMRLHADAIDIGSFGAYIPANLPLEIRSGTAKNLDLKLQYHNEALAIRGGLDVENLDGNYKDWGVKETKAHLELSDDTLYLSEGKGLFNGQNVDFSGLVGVSKENKALAITVESDAFALHALPFTIPLDIVARGQVLIGGSRDHLVVDGHLAGTEFVYDGKALPDVETDLHYEDLKLYFDNAIVGDGEAFGRGEFDIRTKSYGAEAKMDGVNISPLSGFVGAPIGGAVWGNLYLRGTGTNLETVQGYFKDSNFSYNGVKFGKAEGSIYYDGQRWNVPFLTAQNRRGSLTASGIVDPKNMDLTIAGSDLYLDILRSFVPLEIDGDISFLAEIKGPMDNPTAEISMASEELYIRTFDFHDAKGQAKLANGKLSIQNTSVFASEGRYDLEGDISITGAKDLDLTLRMEKVRIEDLLRPVANLPITGWVSNTTKIGGTLEAPTISGDLVMTDGSAYGKLIQYGEATYAYTPKGLVIQHAKVSAYDATVFASGTVSADGDIQIELEGENIAPARFLSLTSFDVKGVAAVKGLLQGSLKNPIFNGELSSPQMILNGEAIDGITGQIYYDPTVVAFRNCHFTQGKGQYSLAGGYRFEKGEIFGSANAKQGDLGKLLKLCKIPVHEITGDLEGTIDVHGTFKKPDVAIKGTVYDTAILGKIMGESQIDVGLEKNTFTVRKLKIPVEKGFLVMQGKADLRGEADLQIASKDVPITYGLAMAGLDIPVTGVLNGIVNITGDTKSPTMQVSSNVSKLTFNDTTLDNVYLLATSKDGIINVNQLLAEKADNRAKMSGTIPLKAFYDGATAGSDASVHLTLDLQQADLSAIPLFLPIVEKGEGEVKGKLEFTGVAGDFAVNGDISTEDGTLWLKSVNEPIEHVNTLLHFDGHKAVFTADGAMGGGTIQSKGEAAWTNNTFTSYGLDGSSTDVNISSTYFKGPLQGNFFLKKGNKGPILGGYLNLNKTMMIVPITFESTESNLDLGLDFTVEATENARLYNSLLYDLNVQGKAHFGGSTIHPDVDGRFSVTQGSIKYLNNQFKVTEGVAEFNQTDSFLPSLKLKADTTVDTYTIKFGLEGPLSHMDLHLSSTPALSQQQIVALLTVRKLSLNDDGVEKNAINSLLTTGLQMMLLGDVENTLKETLALDEFRLSQSYLDPFAKKLARKENGDQLNYYSLSIGKELFKDFMVTFGTGLNYNLSKFGMSYQITKHIGMDTWFTTDHNAYMGLQYKYRF